MVNEQIKIGDSLMYKLGFEDLNELVDYIKKTKACNDTWGPDKELASRKGEVGFCGTSSMDEALKLCLYGDTGDFDNFLNAEQTLTCAFPVLTQKRRTVQSIYGFKPDIPKAITNNPRSMYKLQRKEEYRFISIYFNCAVNCGTYKKQIYNKGIITMSLISILENLGYRVNLNFFDLSEEGYEYIYIVTNIKRQAEKLDKSICYFPMCHPSFLRRIMFAVEEKIPADRRWRGGYGHPCNESDLRGVMKLDSSSIIIASPDNLGIRGDNLFKDARAFLDNINFNKFLGVNEKIEFNSENNTFEFVKTLK